jgi:hypothetical protein
LTPVIQQLQAAHRRNEWTVLHLHLNNCKIHDSKYTQACYGENSVVCIPHPRTLRI